VQEPSAAESEAWQRLPFDPEHFRAAEMKAPAITGEPEQGVLNRMWARPTLEVHGIRGGFTGEGAKTVIPARAVAKISMRLVPDQRPEEVSKQFGDAVADACPKGITAEWKAIHSAPPSLSDTENRFIQTCADAMTEIFGNKTVYVRSGGSIPIVGLFRQHLGIPSVLAGFGLPDDNLHGPNEKLYLPNFYRGIDATIRYLEKLS
jgi:acetylornithine deacetylase/succinyl-diaminopimelate desuccinylase-like protein